MKTALISGGCSGIGLATARRLQADGYAIIACDLNEPGDELAAEFQQQGVRYFQMDVADADAVASTVEEILAECGPVTALINSAGISGFGSVTDTSLEDYRWLMSINLDGSVYLSRALLPQMVEAGNGCIVNLASIFGLTALGDNLSYNVAKGGVVQLTRSIAVDYAAKGIRCNAVAPGLIETPLTDPIKSLSEMHQEFVNWHLQGRAGKPEEVASVIAFLCSEDASFVNGQTLAVDGGFTAGRRFS